MSFILNEIDEPIGTIILNHPEKRKVYEHSRRRVHPSSKANEPGLMFVQNKGG